MNIGKKLLSLLTVLCLTLSLFPTMALAADGEESTGSPATSVSVGSATLNSDTPYLVKGKTNGQSTITEQEKTAGYIYFDASNSTLTLNNYSSTTSHQICGNAGEDLIIKLNGDNRITSSGNGIRSYGKLTISGPGSLTLTAAINTTIYAKDTITIQGGAKVTAPCGQDGQSIHLNEDNKEIIITGSNTEVNASNSTNRKGEIRCGYSATKDTTCTGLIQLNDGAKLTASKINGTLKINGQDGNRGDIGDVTASPTTYTVSGTVKNGTTLVAGASVQLCTTGTDATTSVIATSTTDNNGKYSLTGISEGSYTIKASKNGYDVWSETIQINADITSKNITLTQSTTYNVWVGGTQVTSANKDNVLGVTNANGTPTVTYTPASSSAGVITPQKLTLNGMSITNTSQIGITASNDLTIALSGENNISSSAHAIEMTSGTLTITGPGSLNASSSSGQTTIYAEGSGDVIINGGAQITAENTSNGMGDAIHLEESNKNLTVTGNGTQLIARKTEGKQTAINGVDTLAVSDGATLTAQSNGTAISCTTFSADENCSVKVSNKYNGTDSVDYSSTTNNLSSYQYVQIQSDTTPVVGYNVWVGDTQITSANMNNVLGNDGTPTVIYAPDSKTLTLNGAHITGAPNRQYTSTITDACGIYAKHDLTIKLSGTNTVSGSTGTQDNGNYGIFVSGRLTFTSDSAGSITVSGGTSSNNGNAWVPGVYASGITVNNCNVTVSGGTATKDTYPVSYAMSTVPTLIGVEIVNANTANNAADPSLEYNKSKNSTYKYLQITKKANVDTTVADPVIEPESGYFTGAVAVKMSCLTSGAEIYYTTNGSEPTTRSTKYNTGIMLNDTATVKAVAVKDGKQSQIVTATFTKRANSAETVTDVTLNLSDHKKSLTVGMSEQLSATVKHNDDEISGLTVTWISDNPDVATVDASGNITAKELGKARITASVTENGTMFSDFCDVIVTAKTQVAITFNENGGTVSPATANTNAYGKLDSLPTPTRSGYSFDGWYTTAEGGTAVTTDTVFDSIATIYAHWTRNSSSGSHTTYYPVNTPAKSEGGSVVVSPKSASKGSAVTVTVTPESGYQVSSVQAVDKDGKKLTLTDKGDGKYTFVMPASKVEVSASFAQVQKPEEASPYRDVSKDSYYYDAVQWASDKGITNGVSDGVFAPDWVCTRGQIVTFLWRSVGSPAPKTAEMPFADVAEDAYYAQAVLWAVENGITKGTSETTFSPDQTCTRAHAVAFLYRLAGSPAVTGSSFQDVAADAYYNAAVAWAVQQGITNGTSETTFSPDETCTRAQIVTFLYRMDQAK